MIIPSIDLMGGRVVQLVGGKGVPLDCGEPLDVARKLRIAGEIAVIDLDAARGRGNNREIVLELLKIARCRVGGGIRDVESARFFLDRGAEKVILGTAAIPEVLSQLPRDRVIAALDAKNGEVVVEGWTKGTGRSILERIQELDGLVGGYLVTFVEREGRMGGSNLTEAESIIKAADKARVTIAGGITSVEEIAVLHSLGADAQVGMAIYTGRMNLADALAAPLISDRPDKLWPTVVTDEHGTALGLAYSSLESLRLALETGKGVYHSRQRGLWIKGETSGATQDLLAIKVDCDADTLLFIVHQHGDGFCHKGDYTCWGPARGLTALESTIQKRAIDAIPGSYTQRLLSDRELLDSKLVEEAHELSEANKIEDVIGEAADVLYFTMVALARSGAKLDDVERELDRRALRITRRKGDMKTNGKKDADE